MNYKNIFCGNCGKKGHIYKKCYKPVMSLGIICIKYDDGNINDIIKKCKSEGKIFNRYNISDILDDEKMVNHIKSKLKFLMICRKHSLSYIEIIQGNYNFRNDDDIKYIMNIFNNMTINEINIIKNKDFDYIWNDLWVITENNNLLKKKYIQSKNRFNQLIKGIKNMENNIIDLDYIIENCKKRWIEPEWEFPKGRRKIKEIDIDCAIREFEEETNFSSNDYEILGLNPISEIFMGNNNINYKYTYFFSQSLKNNNPNINTDNFYQQIEISDIKWLSYDEAYNKIRSYSTERKNILNKFFNLIYYYLYHYSKI